MIRTLLPIALLSATLLANSLIAAEPTPVDPTVSEETHNLLLNLHRLGWDTDKIMFGQEFPLSYSKDMVGINDPTTSDVKDVVGDHPGVHGSDFHFLIDKDAHERVAHKAAAKAAYQAGAMVTFDYHWLGKYGGTHNWHEDDAKILHRVVTNDDSNGDVTWFYQSLDNVLRVINEDLQFPIVFRPLHEMNGNWFWWGSRLEGGPETYRRAYQLLVEYMSEKSEYVLFAWSPDKSLALDYYPGDEYVDIIGVDGYGEGNPNTHWFTVDDMVTLLEEAVDFAVARGKVAAFTETGYHTYGEIAYHTDQPDWWTRSVLEPILASEKASRIAWVLTWINSDWSGPYAPTAESPAASQKAFRDFHAHPSTLFQNDVAAERIYQSPKQAKATPKAVDPTLTPETQNLLASLHRIGWDPDKIAFGQEFPLTFNRAQSFNTNLDQSDIGDLLGDLPGVHGSDFLYMMFGNTKERPHHVAAAKKAYQEGAIVTFDFHWRGKYSNEFYYDERDAQLLYNLVHNDDSNGDVTWFYEHLDQVLQLINDEIGIPIVFRPFHEMNGNWFWWGSKMKGGPEVYQQAFRLLVDYIRERSDLVLFCWSPDKGLFTEYYPGDDYVDVIGMDVYDTGSVEWASVEQMVGWLEDAVDFAAERGKVAAFTETGNRVDYPNGKPRWWTEQILDPILASPKARQVAWILTWINAQWSGPYVPASDSPQAAKDDFKKFYNHPVTLFQKEIAAENVYSTH